MPGMTPTKGKPAMLHAPGIPEAFSQADVDFMTGMIPHHAQALIMAGWAPTHGARSDVAILCERIVVGQGDEIKLMQQWLSDRGRDVPDGTSIKFVEQLQKDLAALQGVDAKIASGGGRMYVTMDRYEVLPLKP